MYLAGEAKFKMFQVTQTNAFMGGQAQKRVMFAMILNGRSWEKY